MSLRELVILGCSSQQPTRQRNHGAYLLRWNGEGFLFDPGEGTQRQFIFANIPPTVVTYLLVSHFHGDHCLGVGSMLMRLNLDKVEHPIHCYYPASGEEYFKRLRYGTIYKEAITVVEHPVVSDGLVFRDSKFTLEAAWLSHGVDNLAWRITEADKRKFFKEKLAQLGIRGPLVRTLEEEKEIVVGGRKVYLDEVSYMQKGDTVAIVSDTRFCKNAIEIARGAKLLLCESTYLEDHHDLAEKHGHLTAREAALIAKEAGVGMLVLTHFSARYPDPAAFEKEARPIFPNTYAAEDFKVFTIAR